MDIQSQDNNVQSVERVRLLIDHLNKGGRFQCQVGEVFTQEQDEYLRNFHGVKMKYEAEMNWWIYYK